MISLDTIMHSEKENHRMLTNEDREELVNRVMKVYTSLDGLANLVNKSNFE